MGVIKLVWNRNCKDCVNFKIYESKHYWFTKKEKSLLPFSDVCKKYKKKKDIFK